MDNDTLTGNAVINGIIGNNMTTASTSTFSAGDQINATGSNNTLNIVDVTGGTSLLGATTVSGVQTVNLTSAGAAGQVNFSNFSGLTTLNVTEAGGTTGTGITAAATTAVNASDTAAGSPGSFALAFANIHATQPGGAGTDVLVNGYDVTAAGIAGAATTDTFTVTESFETVIQVQGGSNVCVTANNVNGGATTVTDMAVSASASFANFGTINVGTTTAVSGTVTVVANQLATATGLNGGDNINVKGGTVDTITANLSD